MMNRRLRATLGLLSLTLLSQIATAQADGLRLSSMRTGNSPSLASPVSGPPTGPATIELTLTGGAPGAQAWLVAVDAPRELVALRARLEGVTSGPALTGEHDWHAVQFDAAGHWTASFPESSLRTWVQAIVPKANGGYRFSDLTKGARYAPNSPNAPTQTSAFGAPSPQYGFVVVTEFMKDPTQVSDTAGEWVELTNIAPYRINLEGLVLSDDGSNAHLIFNGGAGLWFLPGERLVLGRNEDPNANGGVDVDYAYSSFTLSNSDDQIILTGPGGRLLDRVDYDNGVLWPDTSGQSISLAPGFEDAVGNDDPAHWCHASSFVGLGSGDAGTPGLPNDVCP